MTDSVSSDRFDLRRPLQDLHPNERLKYDARNLRGTIQTSLLDQITGAVADDDTKLLKFHGIYQQSNRDEDPERRRARLEPSYQFMLRVRLPGGVIRPQQWRALDELADRYGDGGLRLTTRQTFQFHGVLKRHLPPLIQGLHAAGLDSKAACGDDSRGVMCGVNPELSALHRQIHQLARRTSDHLIPRTGAYRELWLADQPAPPLTEQTLADEEPLYGRTYLPRKFKVGFALPPVNDIDVLTQDLGFIAIVEQGELVGFNVAVGGGMGRTDNAPDTYPMLASVVGFVPVEAVLATAEATMLIQRDYGNRKDRSRARFKYTIDELGTDWFRQELSRRLGQPLEEAKPYHFESRGDAFGWARDEDGRWHGSLLIPSGRVRGELKQALAEFAALELGELRLTANQNLTLCGLDDHGHDIASRMLGRWGLDEPLAASPLRRQAISCVALPTCGLAMAESERWLPTLLDKVEAMLARHGLAELPISLRVSGCPNGCARPYAAEIGFSGRGPGRYNVYLGGDASGQRMNQLWLDNATEEAIYPALEAIFQRYAAEHEPAEGFGDFVVRTGIVGRVRHGREVIPLRDATATE